ncbi:phosphatidate cytidylyltransferase [Agriterribacter sp.]|uniref:phosphatidate cytidylyltransferase n=1 Tax=Agriterribacter sp. TaxID=2821509 RepID=UPI002CC5A507|nr:phosphatidate cytidylyltransferase [Agriterribacter sp.]HRP58162.1 phosphatidate cytidylyltransferase [Agriterribacter sp.]
MRKQRSFPVMISMAAIFLFSGCTVVEGIFKAGMWWAFFLVAVVVVLILWIIAKARKK